MADLPPLSPSPKASEGRPSLPTRTSARVSWVGSEPAEGEARGRRHSSHSDDESSATTSGEEAEEEAPAAARRSSTSSAKRAQLLLKFMLIVCLLAGGAAVAIIAYNLATAQEAAKFKAAFAAAVELGAVSLADGYRIKLRAGAILASHLTSSFVPWNLAIGLPYTTYWNASHFDDFDTICREDLTVLASARAFAWAPLISAPDQPAFDAVARGHIPEYPGITPGAWALGTWVLNAAGTGPVLPPPPAPFRVPALQISPLDVRYLMMDFFSYPDLRHALAGVATTNEPVQSDIIQLASLGYNTTASSVLFSPVFDRTPYEGGEQQLVGFTAVVFAWTDMIFSALNLAGYSNLVAVLTSDSGRQVSFLLENGQPVDLPANHTRDAAYESYRHDLTGTFGPGWLVSFYPTAGFAQRYSSNQPTLQATVIALLVGIICSDFGTYDLVAATRQRALTKLWQATEAVVSDIFPQKIKDQLMSEQLAQRGSDARSSTNPGGGILFSALGGLVGTSDKRSPTRDTKAAAVPLAALAELYPHTTVVFADVVGFTSWSSSVPPAEVLRFLEGIFGEFDILAKSLDVFKVETIGAAPAGGRPAVRPIPRSRDSPPPPGDCYVACCGCPDAYENHAERAADFALGMGEAFKRGAPVNAANLCLRVGLHSGPVVAGMLRQERGRFQLFGDTVNTASRMESTGEAEKVQCSAATAELLLSSGRHALRRRGVIAVKGKGSIETFWLTGRHGRYGGRVRARGSSRTSERASDSLVAQPRMSTSARASAAAAAEDLAAIIAAEAGEAPILVEEATVIEDPVTAEPVPLEEEGADDEAEAPLAPRGSVAPSLKSALASPKGPARV